MMKCSVRKNVVKTKSQVILTKLQQFSFIVHFKIEIIILSLLYSFQDLLIKLLNFMAVAWILMVGKVKFIVLLGYHL